MIISELAPTLRDTVKLGDFQIRIYQFPIDYRKRNHLYNSRFFLNKEEVAKIINQTTTKLNIFMGAEEKRMEHGIPRHQNSLPSLEIKGSSKKIEPILLHTASLFWLQHAMLNNSIAFKLSRQIASKSLESRALELFGNKDVKINHSSWHNFSRTSKTKTSTKSFLQQELEPPCSSEVFDKDGNQVYLLNDAIALVSKVLNCSFEEAKHKIYTSTDVKVSFKPRLCVIKSPLISKEQNLKLLQYFLKK
ncbi:MAG: hypothetical protein AAFW70_16585 [Cyanobacteria bacterium J06635_10]